jgi:hypothetical protein
MAGKLLIVTGLFRDRVHTNSAPGASLLKT